MGQWTHWLVSQLQCEKCIILHLAFSSQVVRFVWSDTQSPWKLPFYGLTDSCPARSLIDNSPESCYGQETIQRFHFTPSSIWHVHWEERKLPTFSAQGACNWPETDHLIGYLKFVILSIRVWGSPILYLFPKPGTWQHQDFTLLSESLETSLLAQVKLRKDRKPCFGRLPHGSLLSRPLLILTLTLPHV